MSRRCARRARRLRTVVLTAVVAILVVLGGGCGGSVPRQHDVDAALKAASAALVAHDVTAWGRALPTEGTSARRAARQIYAGLTGFKWRSISAEAVAVDGVAGRYLVTFRGEHPGSGVTHDVCRRVLDFATRKGVLTLVGDHTAAARRADYCLAFSHPVVMVRKHLILIGDRGQQWLMKIFAATDGQGRRVVIRLHLNPKLFWVTHRTIVYVCRTAAQASRVAGGKPDTGDGAFAGRGAVCAFARSAFHWRHDAARVMRHELTHVYASGIGEGRHTVGLLVEGLAVVAEGRHSYARLRSELAHGNRVLPLEKTLAQEDVWSGRTHRQVVLAYEEGGALVLYIEKRWSMKRLWKFAAAVADSNLKPVGIEQATGRTLGITWDQLYAGWKEYVRTLR